MGWRWFGEDSTTAVIPPHGLQTGDAWWRSSGENWGSFVPHCCAEGNMHYLLVPVRTELWRVRVQRSTKREVRPEGWEAARGGGGGVGDDDGDGDSGWTACVQGTAPWARWRSSGGCWGPCLVSFRCSTAGTFLTWSWRCPHMGTGSHLSPWCLQLARPGCRWWPGRRGRWGLPLERSWASGPGKKYRDAT